MTLLDDLINNQENGISFKMLAYGLAVRNPRLYEEWEREQDLNFRWVSGYIDQDGNHKSKDNKFETADKTARYMRFCTWVNKRLDSIEQPV